MNPARVVSAIIVSLAYWAFVGFLMLSQLDCIDGSAEYPCPTDGERYRAWLVVLVISATVYALGWRWVRNRQPPNPN